MNANVATQPVSMRPAPKVPLIASLISPLERALSIVLRFSGPADRAVERFFETHPKLGATERTCIAQAIFAVLRNLIEWTYLAREPEEGVPGLWIEPVDTRAWAAFFAQAPSLLRRRLAVQSLSHTLGYESVLAALDGEQAAWLSNNALHGPSRLHAHFAVPELINFPAWLADMLAAQYAGPELAECVAALQTSAPLDLRVNPLRVSRSEVLEALAAQGIEAEPTRYAPLGIRVQGNPKLTKASAGPAGVGFQKGWFEIQDEGSQLLAHLVAPKRGQTVVDFCAGAGGKTLALGALMRSTGRVYALDVDAKRLTKLEARRERSGLSNVHAIAIDSEHDSKLQRFIGPTAGKADRVLVDAPCSGLGTLRRQPDLKWRHTLASIADFANRQRSILRSAARLVKAGGRLIYATCSFLEMENEAVVAHFLAEHPQFHLLSAQSILAAQHIPLQTQCVNISTHSSSASSLKKGDALKLWPHRDGTDAFFAIVLEKE